MGKKRIRIVVADDHKIMRDGLRTLIEKEPGMEVVGDAQDGREALKRVRELKPDVVIMDVTMPNLNGIEAPALINKLRSYAATEGIPIVCYSPHVLVDQMKAALTAGAAIDAFGVTFLPQEE